MNKSISPKLCDFHACTGCGACANACPTDALQLRPDGGEGFYRPVIDPSRCINCLKCERTCPVLNPVLSYEESDLVFAAWHKDSEISRLSSSGGAFSALAQSVLDEGGSVIGVAGFRAFLGEKTYSNLVLVDFICHGVPSPRFFQKYIG